jgi:hypothetical protein
MALQTEREELLAAWRALAGQIADEGWRTIPVALGGPCRLRAGRHFPGNEEALLVGFTSESVPPADQLPQGRGFLVSHADIEDEGESCRWIALRRQSAGSLDLFAMMVVDVVTTLAGLSRGKDGRTMQVFLSRIRAWQDFMRRGSDDTLSAEAEVGLFGEIEFLRQLFAAGLPATVSIEAWKGPLDELQDFRLGTGAIEVKSTLSNQGFPAAIGSLEQLDDSLVHPLYLVGVRLAIKAAGITLAELISDIRDSLVDDPAAFAAFNTRLLHAGYFDQFAERYTRRFACVAIRLLTVCEGFPRLTRGSVATAIRDARYEVDLDLVPDGEIGLLDSLRKLGVA